MCAAAQGLYRRPDIVSERDVLKMATVNGYAAQGRDDCGRVKQGIVPTCRSWILIPCT